MEFRPGDIVLEVDLSIWSGIKNVEFVVKTGMESDLSLHSEASETMPRKEVVLATIPGPIITPYTGVNIHTRLSFIAGAEGQIDVGLETGFNLKRGYEVGLEWAKGKGFSPVHRITGDGWSAREPTLSGKASAFAFAGAKIDGLLYGVVGPFAELYGYGQLEAESKLSPSEMTWEYDLGVGLACVEGASLELRWLAWSISENWKTDPIQLYHVPIAYGVSGRVVDDNGAGIGNVKLQFSNGADPAYTNGNGYWSKHFLLPKKATVTPTKDGYTFVPATREVTSGKSSVNFTGTPVQQPSYAVSGRVADSGGVGVGGVTIAFSGGYGSVTTASDGTWSKSGLKGTVTVTPAKDGWTFSPPNRQVSAASGNVNFSASKTTYTVSGRVTHQDNGQGLEGVAIGFSGGFGTATTGADGTWSKSGLAGNVTVTPTKEGWTFDPTNRQVSGAAGNVDFAATQSSSFPIAFEDPNLEAVVRETIGKPTGQLMNTDVAHITELNASNRGISSLGGIEHLVKLYDLNIGYNNISDLSPLSGLTDLMYLYAWNNTFSDLTPLSGLTNLRMLYFHECPVTDLTPIAGLTDLGTLAGHDSLITDISPIAGLTDLSFIRNLTNMESLYLHSNQISDIGVLGNMAELDDLLIHGNQIADITPLAGLTKLKRVYLGCNRVSSIGALSGLIDLKDLSLWHNQISDISPLSGLTALENLSISRNQVSDISPLGGLANLLCLYLSENQVADIDCLAGFAELETLRLDHNFIEDIDPLVANSGLGSGDYITLEYNRLDLSDGSDDMQNINTLIERGATVHFRPQRSDSLADAHSFDDPWNGAKYDPIDCTLIVP